MRYLSLLLALGSFAALGCQPEIRKVPATQVTVRIDASAQVREASLQLRVRLASKHDGAWREWSREEYSVAAPKGWPVEVVVLPDPAGAPDGQFEVIVEALVDAGRLLAQQRAIVRFVPRKNRVLPIALDTCGERELDTVCASEVADCLGPDCRTCVQGQCAPTPSYDADDLEPFDGSSVSRPPMRDGAPDAASSESPDARVEPAPPSPDDCRMKASPDAYCAAQAAGGLSAKCVAGTCVPGCADPDQDVIEGQCAKHDDCAGVTSCGTGACVDGVRSFSCLCPTGETGTGSPACGPNPCAAGLELLCGAGAAACENVPSGYSCKCAPGYETRTENAPCVDILECAAAQGGCEDRCNEEPGGYFCQCDGDRVLATDEKSCRVPAWSPLATLTRRGLAVFPHVAVSRAGAVAVWSQNTAPFAIEASHYAAGRWSEVRTVAGGATLISEVVLSRSDRAVSTFVQIDAQAGYSLASAAFEGEWSPARQVDSLAGSGWQDVAALGSNEEGHTFLVWGRGARQPIQLARLGVDGAWEQPQTFAVGGHDSQRAHQAALAVSANRKAVAIWSQLTQSLSSDAVTSQAYFSYQDGISWSVPIGLGAAVAGGIHGGGVAAVADDENQLHMLWQEGPALRHARATLSNTPTDLGEVPTPMPLPSAELSQLSAGASGSTVAVSWTFDGRKSGALNRWTPGEGWSASPWIFSSVLSPSDDSPKVGVTPGGSVVIVYVERVAELRYLTARRLLVDGTLEQPVTLNMGLAADRNLGFDFAVDRLGRATVVWNEAQGGVSSHVFARRLE